MSKGKKSGPDGGESLSFIPENVVDTLSRSLCTIAVFTPRALTSTKALDTFGTFPRALDTLAQKSKSSRKSTKRFGYSRFSDGFCRKITNAAVHVIPILHVFILSFASHSTLS